MLRDSAHIQEKDAVFLNKRHRRRKALEAAPDNGEVAAALHDRGRRERAEAVRAGSASHTPKVLDPALSYEAYDAGHILGSTAMLLHYHENGKRIRLVFSGDVGRPNLAIIRDPGQHAAGRLPDHGEHLRRPPAQGRGHGVRQARRHRQPHLRGAAARSSSRRSPWAARSSSCCCCTS